jgi:hypothetical protein
MNDYMVWFGYSSSTNLFTTYIVPAYGMGSIVKGKKDLDESSFTNLLIENLPAHLKSPSLIKKISDSAKMNGFYSLLEIRLTLSNDAAHNLGWIND